MPLAILLLSGLIFTSGAAIALLYALGVLGQSSKAVRDRLSSLRVANRPRDTELGPVLSVRETNGRLMSLFASGASRAKIERNILLAGRPDGWTVRRVLGAKLIFTSIGLLLLLVLVSGQQSVMRWVIGLLAIFVAYFAPDIIIQKRGQARQESIQEELPDVLDQVTISIESGLGFESAFARLGERRTGPLAEEIVRAVQDMRLGMSRKEAYQALADRTDVDDLRKFVKSVIQAELYGVSIATVVRTQAIEIRFSRRKRAEARALKVPVKIVFPLMACILPVLFIFILTPAVINIGTAIGNR